MRPNIIFINTDQQTYDCLSAFGNPFLNTPNMDSLVENGTTFVKSYSTDPVCAPARSSWATGLYSSETGVSANGCRMYDASIPDTGQILNANGYNAYHTGKWHVPGRDVRKSFRCLYFGKRAIVVHVVSHVLGELRCVVAQRLGRVARHDEEPRLGVRLGARRLGGRLVEDHVRVGAADPERGNPSTAHPRASFPRHRSVEQ